MTQPITAEAFHARIWEILEPVDSTCFEVVAAPAPSAQAVAALEASVGFPLPPAFAGFCQRNNGLCVMARDEFWPQAKEFAVGPAWTFWRGLVLLGIDAPDLPEWASISAQHKRLVEDEVTTVIPLLKIVGDGNRVWGMDSAGVMVEVLDFEDPTPLTGDLLEVYAEQIAELIQRQQDMMQRIAKR